MVHDIHSRGLCLDKRPSVLQKGVDIPAAGGESTGAAERTERIVSDQASHSDVSAWHRRADTAARRSWLVFVVAGGDVES